MKPCTVCGSTTSLRPDGAGICYGCQKLNTAPDFLRRALDALEDRAASRDQPNGERSMTRTVEAFNAIYDLGMTERQGWAFMVLLKLVRGSQGEFRADDYIDAAAYAALCGESG